MLTRLDRAHRSYIVAPYGNVPRLPQAVTRARGHFMHFMHFVHFFEPSPTLPAHREAFIGLLQVYYTYVLSYVDRDGPKMSR